MRRPPWRYPSVGSPALGTLKRICGTRPMIKETKSKIVARRTGRSMLAKADNGDLGDRILTWKIKRINSRRVELLPMSAMPEKNQSSGDDVRREQVGRVIGDRGSVLEEIEVHGVGMDDEVKGAQDGRL
jgi:hypothetical protein